MSTHFKLLLTFFIVLSITLQAQQESLSFEIIHSDKPIGTLNAIKETKDGKTTYTDNTSIITHIFTKIEVDYKYESVYVGNQLNNSNVIIMLNGHVRTKTSTKKENSAYVFYKNGEIKNKINQHIYYSSIRLMFEEPINISEIYAEEHGIFHSLKKIAEHTYLKTTPEGHKNTYYYKDGNLQKAEIHTGIVSFNMVRKN